MKLACFLVIGLFGCIACGQNALPASPSKHDEAFWRARAAKVHAGMTRAEVERLLPPRSVADGMWTGGSYGISYALDAHWKVAVHYDYTGIAFGKDGKALSRESASNRVIASSNSPTPVRLYQKETPQNELLW